MYNKKLEYLLSNDPARVIHKWSYRLRKAANPLIRNMLAPATSPNKYHIDKRKDLPKDRPLIFACTHQCKDDIALGLVSAGRHTYLLFASLPDFLARWTGPRCGSTA